MTGKRLYPLTSLQNIWIKTAIFVAAILSFTSSSRRYTIIQLIIFSLYFLIDHRYLPKILFAFRKVMPFLTVYWVMGTIFGLDFIAMVDLTLRIILAVMITVFLFGSIRLELVLRDLNCCFRYATARKAMFYLLATYMFIRCYHQLWMQQPQQHITKLQEAISRVTDLLAKNYAQTPRFEQQIETILSKEYKPREFFTAANLAGIAFLTLILLSYSL